MKLSKYMQNKLICPCTQGKIKKEGDDFRNVINSDITYPIIDGIPVLINNENSIFSIDDFSKRKNTTFNLNQSVILKLLKKIRPDISINIKSKGNYKKIVEMLPSNSKILVIGGSVKGKGMDVIYSNELFDIVGSDVSFGQYTNIISDAHDIPFDDGTFDCVFIQAVLEHVLDPQRCVSEVYRVLKPSGIVYAETPFMQQVHMKQYDFTRFTHLGHRRLFRCFDEVDSGPACGPGMALAWAYTYFLRSFVTSKAMVRLSTTFAYMTSFFLKYFDYYLIDKPGSYDSASGYFFIGRKSTNTISDNEIIRGFKGIK